MFRSAFRLLSAAAVLLAAVSIGVMLDRRELSAHPGQEIFRPGFPQRTAVPMPAMGNPPPGGHPGGPGAVNLGGFNGQASNSGGVSFAGGRGGYNGGYFYGMPGGFYPNGGFGGFYGVTIAFNGGFGGLNGGGMGFATMGMGGNFGMSYMGYGINLSGALGTQVGINGFGGFNGIHTGINGFGGFNGAPMGINGFGGIGGMGDSTGMKGFGYSGNRGL